MGKSDEYIDYKAYVRYLRKVTGEQADTEKIEAGVLACAVERTEMQTAYDLLWKTCVAAAVVFLVAFLSSLPGIFRPDHSADPGTGVWEAARLDEREHRGLTRLYDAYMFSDALGNMFVYDRI